MFQGQEGREELANSEILDVAEKTTLDVCMSIRTDKIYTAAQWSNL